MRAFGAVDPARLEALKDGITIGGIAYGPIRAQLDRRQGGNVWLTVALEEGKNREIRKVMEHLGLSVNRLIRIAYGPFQLGNLKRGQVAEVTGKVLGEQLSQADGARAKPPPRRRRSAAP